MELIELPKDAKPDEVHVFNVHANYGNYQIAIGPKSQRETKQVESKEWPVEINGDLHHLFVSKRNIAPNPSHSLVSQNLKGCVIIKDLTFHLVDPTGSGRKLENRSATQTLYAREKINLAGEEGTRLLRNMEESGKLAKAAYRIVQKDILKALTKR